MKNRLLYIFVFVCFALSTSIMAQSTPAQNAQRLTNQLDSRVTLTTAQKTQILDVNVEYFTSLAALPKNALPVQKSALKTIRVDAIDGILTATQKTAMKLPVRIN